MAPKSVARGAPRSGDRAAVGAETARLHIPWALASRYGVASSFGRHCSALRGRTRFYRNPTGQSFARGLLCQAPSEGRPRSVARRPREAGSGSEGGCDDRTYGWPRRASRCGVASSFRRHCSALRGRAPKRWARDPRSGIDAHPIPQSRRRAPVGFIQKFPYGPAQPLKRAR